MIDRMSWRTETPWRGGYRPSNGTEGEMFQARYCYRSHVGCCLAHLVDRSLSGERFNEWQDRFTPTGYTFRVVFEPLETADDPQAPFDLGES